MASIKTLLAGAATFAFLGLAPLAAQASVVYSNLNLNPADGDCSFNTTCAAAIPSRGDEFAAQAFSLGSTATITSGSWTELDSVSSGSSSVNYAFYADGGSGVPVGGALFSGSAATSATDLGPGADSLEVFRVDFNLGSITLGAGDYFFAVQDVSSNIANYLGQGTIHAGAAESNDGGLTWAPGYENLSGGDQLSGLSVALYGPGVPEPTSWALMLVGFGGLGAALRRRRNAATLA